ncbi:MAG: flagellar motor protein MotA [Chromatiaceae bacterium]|jgi:hypothetical protein|nr:flagellar motor protein MotA [Chromatiaceae bacterium]
MSSPKQSLFWMAVYLATVAAIGALLFVPLRGAFMANWGFNSLILAVLAVGLVINLRHVVVLGPEIAWIKLFRTGETGISVAQEPRLLKPLARHLQGRRKDRFRLSALALRTVLDGIRARLDESREISRYIIGLLIFLGLLGTFWGLLGTISAVGRVIAGLDVSGGDAELVFRELRAGLEAPLAGMGTAFSSSLFGLGGSLVLGFLDLQASHAQNRFFNGLEEWLTGVTQLIDEPGRGRVPEGPPVEIEEAGALTPLLEELRAQRRLLEGLLGGSGSARGGAAAAAADDSREGR